MRIRQARKILNRQIENDCDDLFCECLIYGTAKLRKAYRTWKTRQNRKETRQLERLLREAWLRQMDRFLTKKAHQHPWNFDIKVEVGTLPTFKKSDEKPVETLFDFTQQFVEIANKRYEIAPSDTTTTESD